ncbi:hypothetical protein BVRB_4g079260 [Beta vulgaris subsp. vulgaris]|nr:hypothetical protein BVRB_4g079260 [Beta vulgaris subsp. vulgaris]
MFNNLFYRAEFCLIYSNRMKIASYTSMPIVSKPICEF